MKLVILLCVLMLLFGCQSSGEIVSTPNGMENAVKQYLASNYKMQEVKSLTVRKFPQDTYLVTVNYIQQEQTYQSTVHLIAQPANNQSVWQIKSASKQDLQNFKIK